MFTEWIEVVATVAAVIAVVSSPVWLAGLVIVLYGAIGGWGDNNHNG